MTNDRRKEARQSVPELYQKYIELKVRKEPEGFMAVELLDFSPSGIRMRLPFVPDMDAAIQCLISIPRSLSKEISFFVMMKYFTEDEQGRYLAGAEVIETSDRLWLNLFSKVHDFIKQRMNDIF